MSVAMSPWTMVLQHVGDVGDGQAVGGQAVAVEAHLELGVAALGGGADVGEAVDGAHRSAASSASRSSSSRLKPRISTSIAVWKLK